MIKHHYFNSIEGLNGTAHKYQIKHRIGDFHIFIIQHSSPEGSLRNAPSNQPERFSKWVVTQPMELVYQSPYKIVNYRDQSYGARLEMRIYRSFENSPEPVKETQ